MNPGAAAGLAAIDWSRPWLARWRALGEPLAAQALRVSLLEALEAADRDAVTLSAGRVRFVEPAARPAGEAYESFIARTGCVPTRANLHDFFNALAWLLHPALKRRLNELHARAIAGSAAGPSRGPVRDALTLFDENAALWQAPAMLVEALRRRDWQALFVTHRAAWERSRLELFGHALLEKLVQPRKGITAHVWVLPGLPDDVPGPSSAWLAEVLEPAALAAKPFLPLPVLGVPGWWGPNDCEAFYRDSAVFRPAPMQTAARGPLS